MIIIKNRNFSLAVKQNNLKFLDRRIIVLLRKLWPVNVKIPTPLYVHLTVNFDFGIFVSII